MEIALEMTGQHKKPAGSFLVGGEECGQLCAQELVTLVHLINIKELNKCLISHLETNYSGGQN